MKSIITGFFSSIAIIVMTAVLFVRGGQTTAPAYAQYDLGAGCFLAGTLVATPWGMVPIEEVRVGQEIRSFDPVTRELKKGVVTSTHSYKVDVYYEVALDTGVTLKATREHPIYKGSQYRSPYIDPITKLPQWEGFEAVQYLSPGDTVYALVKSKALAPVKVVSVKKLAIPAVVYNMTVMGEPTYFADNVAVHNQPVKNNSSLGVCGDGDCMGGETQTSCPIDCAGPTVTSSGPSGTVGANEHPMMCYDASKSPPDYSCVTCVDNDLNDPSFSCPAVGCNVTCGVDNKGENKPACTQIPNGPNAGGSCGGRQLCPAEPGGCSYVAGGITIGENPCAAEDGLECWTLCCSPAVVVPSPSPGQTATATPTTAVVNGPQQNSSPPPVPTPTGPSCDPAVWGPWSACAGNPATTSRQNQCGPIQTAYCTGTIRARGSLVSSADTSCAAIRASTTYADGTIFFSTPTSAQQLPPKTQAGGAYVSWATVLGGNYTLADIPPADYVIQRACWSTNTGRSGEGLSAVLSVPTDGETLTWDVGYFPGSAWTQASGAHVYASGTLRSFVPVGTSPRSFILDGAGGSPGIAYYGTSYDFDSSIVRSGDDNVSSADWLVNETYPAVNYYDLFYRRFGGPTTADSFADLGAVTKPASRTTPYYVVGNMTTSGDWAVADGETVIFIVNGNLTLGGKVNLTGSGFAAFIVNGNITVASSVGGLYTSSSPVIEGIYVTSPSGTFQTGTSTVVGKERLVGQGIFVAGSFLLQRDLESITQNNTTAAELFLYNPRLLIAMPDSMRDVPITWEEVAP